MTEPHELPHLEILLRLLAAFACGAVIGLNREFHRKPAGFRTFALLAIGSAVVVVVMEQEYGTGPDALSRVIQGVLTGVGFLGAGVIFRRMAPAKVAGLTTAAAVWLTAGLGVAAGAGQYFVAFTAAGLGLVLLLVGGPFERLLMKRKKKPDKPDLENEPPT
jgi:putative Mg2+ transporter-C (MgtC) family protein